VPIAARFVHTNLIARDWRRLADFYEDVFGCTRLPPERDLSGDWLDAITGLPQARIQGIHLRLPGYTGSGPTLEIFQYDREEARPATAVNRPGFGHIAFAVEDVRLAREAVLAAGGRAVGDLVSATIPGAGTIRAAYVTDPEDNVIELQRWTD
jgi:catechol 2,3-dioxygenase-like lactoylglutathione lyase family enzyme